MDRVETARPKAVTSYPRSSTPTDALGNADNFSVTTAAKPSGLQLSPIISRLHKWDFTQPSEDSETEDEEEYIPPSLKSTILRHLCNPSKYSEVVDDADGAFWMFCDGELSPFSYRIVQPPTSPQLMFHLKRDNDGLPPSRMNFKASLLQAFYDKVLNPLKERFLIPNPKTALCPNPFFDKQKWRDFYDCPATVRLCSARILIKPYLRWINDDIHLRFFQFWAQAQPDQDYVLNGNKRAPGTCFIMPLHFLYPFSTMILNAINRYHHLVTKRKQADEDEKIFASLTPAQKESLWKTIKEFPNEKDQEYTETNCETWDLEFDRPPMSNLPGNLLPQRYRILVNGRYISRRRPPSSEEISAQPESNKQSQLHARVVSAATKEMADSPESPPRKSAKRAGSPKRPPRKRVALGERDLNRRPVDK